MKQLMRYGVVGVVSNLVIYLLYLLVTYDGVEPKKAMTFLYIIGASISFFANKKFTFSYKGRVFQSGVSYAIAHFFGYLLNLFILMVFVDKIGYRHQIVQCIAIFVVAAFLFMCFKLYVFRDTTNRNAKVLMLEVFAPLKISKTRKVCKQRKQKD